MGLPRYLKTLYPSWLASLDAEDIYWASTNLHKYKLYHITGNPKTSFKTTFKGIFRKLRLPSSYADVKWDKKYRYVKVEAIRYSHWGYQDDEHTPLGNDIMVPYSLINKYIDKQNAKGEAGKAAYMLSVKLEKYEHKVYASRVFPCMLRQLIFERDKYICRLCGRSLSVLEKEGHHLEVDHILAYEDGGITVLSNGQTLCSECNKGKHHSKKYKEHVA